MKSNHLKIEKTWKKRNDGKTWTQTTLDIACVVLTFLLDSIPAVVRFFVSEGAAKRPESSALFMVGIASLLRITLRFSEKFKDSKK